MTADLSALSWDRLKALQDAASAVMNVHRILGKSQSTILREMLAGEGSAAPWRHYPDGDVYDAEYFSQYYFHDHPMSMEWPDARGHFHTFLRLPELEDEASDAVHDLLTDGLQEPPLCHLVGVAIDGAGFPVRLFTTNRWVTGECRLPAGRLIGLLDHFEIDHTHPSWAVNVWITNLLRMFRPQIEGLLYERDRVLAQYADHQPAADPCENEDLETPSQVDVHLGQQIDAITAAMPGARRRRAS